MEESIPLDTANFTCIASNTYGTATRNFRVLVQSRKVAQDPKIDRHYPGNHTLLVGTSNFTLECPIVNSDSFSPLEIVWLRIHKNAVKNNNGDYLYKNGTAMFDILKQCTIVGSCRNPKDDGLYTLKIPFPHEYTLYNLTTEDSIEYW